MAKDDTALLLPRQTEDNFDTGAGNEGNMPQATKTEADRQPVQTNDSDTDSDAGDSDDRIIKFASSNFDDGGKDRVFETWLGMTNSTVAWSWEVTDDDVQLKAIELIKVEDSDKPLRQAEFRNDDTSAQPGDQQSDFFENLSDGSAGLNLAAFRDDRMDLDFDDVYAVRVTWGRDRSSDEGETVSPYFTVMDGPNDAAEAVLQRKVMAVDDAETGTEDDGSGTQRNIVPSSNPSNVSETEVADATNNADSDSSNDDNGGGGGGLSPGVIAGIVVGIVVFLALVGGLVFFLLRRRRKTKRSAGYADPRQNDASNAYIVDKIDTSAQSPRSPYSDDGQEQHTPLDPQAHHNLHNQDAAIAGEGSNGSEYAGLYQANQHQQESSRGADGEPPSPRLQSRSNTGHYSHLVEEGMTADDIRRLEDEERQLDAEIERHGRR